MSKVSAEELFALIAVELDPDLQDFCFKSDIDLKTVLLVQLIRDVKGIRDVQD